MTVQLPVPTPAPAAPAAHLGEEYWDVAARARLIDPGKVLAVPIAAALNAA